MRTYKLTVSYDGRAFGGWQTQANATGVQQVLNKALSDVFGETIIIEGSGRTDKGVHGLGQVASFIQKSDRPFMSPFQITRAVHTKLPSTIRLMQVEEAPEGFHARFHAKAKEYHYLIFAGPHMPASLQGLAYHCRTMPDTKAMSRAAKHLEGTHDFSSFTVNPGYERGPKVRTMYHVRVKTSVARLGAIPLTPGARLITLSVKGSGFLYRMVRSMAGTLLDVGLGEIKPEEISDILQAKHRSRAGVTLPPDGLYLARVWY